MKELSIEEKAKAYDEAIEKAKEYYKDCKQRGNLWFVEDMEDMFPELKESEDERIRKDIIVLIKDWWDRVNKDNISTKEQMLAWLEKQGEQKSYEWSEEDETTKNNISHIIRQYDKISKRENKPCWYIGDCLLWMQNIKERVQPQPKQEWSEEDYNEIETIACHLDNIDNEGMAEVLRNIRDKYYSQSTWKPSEEQMENLSRAFNGATYNNSLLMNLYIDLKKLKE